MREASPSWTMCKAVSPIRVRKNKCHNRLRKMRTTHVVSQTHRQPGKPGLDVAPPRL